MTTSPSLEFFHCNQGNGGFTLAIERVPAGLLRMAAQNLVTGSVGLTVILNIGISKVNPGNRAAYQQLKGLARKKKADPTLAGIPSLEDLEAAMARAKPDTYSKKAGRERASARLAMTEARLDKVHADAKCASFCLTVAGLWLVLVADHGRPYARVSVAYRHGEE